MSALSRWRRRSERVFTFLILAQQLLLHVGRVAPLAAGLAFWPQAVSVILSAAFFGVLSQTRWLPVLVLVGMILLMGGGVLCSSSRRTRVGARRCSPQPAFWA